MSEKSDWEKGYDQAMMRTYGERKALKARIAELEESDKHWAGNVKVCMQLIERYESDIAELEAKLDNWQDCYCEFETIAPDGNLKISVLDLYNRLTEREACVAKLEAENAELKERAARLKKKNKKLKARVKAAASKSTYWDHQNCKCSVEYTQAEEGEK